MLTYCSNIHPGESWADVLSNVESHGLAVKAAVSPAEPFPLGLRISARAAAEIDAAESARFRDWCDENGCHVPTVNGFPHGQFHGRGVKEKVYLPDWRSEERVAYTLRLASLLADWLPEGATGSISTVPIAFRGHWDPADQTVVRTRLIEALEGLERLRQERGREIVLSLEPEPGCVLETTDQTVEFFESLALPATLASLLGVCFDCCHQAVEFETPERAFERLTGAGVRIGKVQVSSALRAAREQFDALGEFDEPVYLHQVVARRSDGRLARFDDLPAFLALDSGEREAFDECRVHFHVPIFAARARGCGTTRDFLEVLLPRLPDEVLLEVETYSWNVLPADLRTETVGESIVRELDWARRAREPGPRSSGG